jgi:hypothetical protein
MDEVYDFLAELSPDDTGRQQIGPLTIRFEGFTDLCIQDALERTSLPDSDPRHLAQYETVYDECLASWAREEGTQPRETGFAGCETNPTLWAVF